VGLFGKKQKAEPRDVLMPGGDTVDIVGESHYQAQLESVAGGKGEESCELEKFAYLVREPDNPYDRNAVAVYIDGGIVGYLSRDDAKEYGRLIDQMWANFACHAVCRARITGGWRRFGSDGATVVDEGHFGVKLALAAPEDLLGANDMKILSPEELAAGPSALDD
jgi:HIRAN domain